MGSEQNTWQMWNHPWTKSACKLMREPDCICLFVLIPFECLQQLIRTIFSLSSEWVILGVDKLSYLELECFFSFLEMSKRQNKYWAHEVNWWCSDKMFKCLKASLFNICSSTCHFNRLDMPHPSFHWVDLPNHPYQWPLEFYYTYYV